MIVGSVILSQKLVDYTELWLQQEYIPLPQNPRARLSCLSLMVTILLLVISILHSECGCDFPSKTPLLSSVGLLFNTGTLWLV